MQSVVARGVSHLGRRSLVVLLPEAAAARSKATHEAHIPIIWNIIWNGRVGTMNPMDGISLEVAHRSYRAGPGVSEA